jgi:ubiquinone/menaquinone biosynthesis C-methylase UbiE
MALTPAFRALRDEVLELAGLRPADRVLDVGAGTGLLALAAAGDVARVLAVDASEQMCARLRENRRRLGIANVEVLHAAASRLPLADDSVDVVISNYCFHHMRDAEKLRALAELRRVLAPAGRLVIADMMFRVGVASTRDRAVVGRFVRRMLRKGPGGALRIAKNALRVIGGRGEQPADAGWWRTALAGTGFVQIEVRALDHEGGIAVARGPHPAIATR